MSVQGSNSIRRSKRLPNFGEVHVKDLLNVHSKRVEVHSSTEAAAMHSPLQGNCCILSGHSFIYKPV